MMDELEIKNYLDAYVICHQLREMGIVDDEILIVLKEQLPLNDVAAVQILSRYYQNVEFVKNYIKKNVSKKDLNKFDSVITEKFLKYPEDKKTSEFGDE